MPVVAHFGAEVWHRTAITWHVAHLECEIHRLLLTSTDAACHALDAAEPKVDAAFVALAAVVYGGAE